MAGYGDNQVFDSLPRMTSAPEDAGFSRKISQARRFFASFGWPVVAGSIVSGLQLVGYALLPQEGAYLLIVATTLLAVGLLLFVLSLIKRRKAAKLYKTGAFHRAAALYKISASRKLFMIAYGVVWGGAAFLCASGILAGIRGNAIVLHLRWRVHCSRMQSSFRCAAHKKLGLWLDLLQDKRASKNLSCADDTLRSTAGCSLGDGSGE